MKNTGNSKKSKIGIVGAIIVIILSIFFPGVRDAVFETNDSPQAVVAVQDSEEMAAEPESVTNSEAVTNSKAVTEPEVTTEQEKSAEPEITVAGFRNQNLLDSHYEKHGREMGFASAKEYEQAAKEVVANPDALHKIEEEDGDDVYYVESTNEFVVVSTDGYIRTYFYPNDGLEYFERQ